MEIDALVFDVGDRVTGWGRIVTFGPSLWFDPPSTAGLAELSSHPRRRSRYAVRLLHADGSIVGGDTGDDGSRPGWGTVTGIWLGRAGTGGSGRDVIDVVSQSPHPASSPPRPRQDSTPPCVEAGTWGSAQLDRARAQLIKHGDDWTVLSISTGGADEHGRGSLEVRVFRVLPPMVRWAITLPDGLLSIVASLAPAR